MPSKLTISNIKTFAESKGGQCLSTEYINAKHKLTWCCSNNHIWDSSYDNALKRWCGICGGTRIILKTFTKELLTNELKELKTITAIANKYGTTPANVTKYLNKFNIRRNRRNNSKHYYDLNLFNKDTEKSFYIAGFLAADGSVFNNCINLVLALKDEGHLIKIKNLLNTDAFITTGNSIYQGKIYKFCRLSLYSKELVNQLKRFNIVRNKTKIYEMPEWLIIHPLINHFLRGYSDGDFCWRIHKVERGINRMIFKLLGTEKFLNQCISIFSKQCNLDLSNKKAVKRKDANVYYCDFGGNIICSKLALWLYKDSTIYLERKRDIVLSGCELAIHKEITKDKLIETFTRLGTQIAVAKELGYSNSRICQLIKEYQIQ